MVPEKALVDLQNLVKFKMKVDPLRDPFAAPAAVAAILAEGDCTEAAALDYIQMLALASASLSRFAVGELQVRLGALLGTSLARLDPKRAERFGIPQ